MFRMAFGKSHWTFWLIILTGTMFTQSLILLAKKISLSSKTDAYVSSWVKSTPATFLGSLNTSTKMIIQKMLNYKTEHSVLCCLVLLTFICVPQYQYQKLLPREYYRENQESLKEKTIAAFHKDIGNSTAAVFDSMFRKIWEHWNSKKLPIIFEMTFWFICSCMLLKLLVIMEKIVNKKNKQDLSISKKILFDICLTSTWVEKNFCSFV